MLQRLGDRIANCLARADDAERRPAEASNEAVRLDNEKLARSWRHLSASYQFVESLERFLLDAQKARGALPPDPPTETEGPQFLPLGATLVVLPPAPVVWEVTPGNAFDPEAVAVLTDAYTKAVQGQSASAHEGIAKCIIAVASEGERDPDKLCHGALALCMTRASLL